MSKKRVFCLILAIVHICTAVSLTAYADTPAAGSVQEAAAESISAGVEEIPEGGVLSHRG